MAFVSTMHDQWAMGRSPLTKLSTHKSDHRVCLAHRPQGLPEAGPSTTFRAPVVFFSMDGVEHDS